MSVASYHRTPLRIHPGQRDEDKIKTISDDIEEWKNKMYEDLSEYFSNIKRPARAPASGGREKVSSGGDIEAPEDDKEDTPPRQVGFRCNNNTRCLVLAG